MSKTDSPDAMLAELGINDTADAEMHAAVRNAVRFLTACVNGEFADVTVGDRIAAAKVILEHGAKRPDLLGELADMAGQAPDVDVAVLLEVLD